MPSSDKRSSYFAAQTAYFQHDPRLATQCHTASPHVATIILHGSKATKLTIGRGHDSEVQVGRHNPRMSRQHFVIEHKPHTGFTLTVQSPNGVLVDRIMFTAGENIPLVKGSTIEVLGTKLVFAGEQEQQEQQQEEQEQQKENQLLATIPTSIKKEPEQHNTSQEELSTKTTTTSMTNSDESTTTCTTTPTSTRMDLNQKYIPDQLSTSLDFLDTLIRILANSRKSSMTIPEIERQLNRKRQDLMNLIQTTACIGCIERTGNTADGMPKENLYYYKPELDADDERRHSLSQSRRGARKCVLKDTQYYFRIPKLPNHRSKPSSDTKRKLDGQPTTKKKRRLGTKESAQGTTPTTTVQKLETAEVTTTSTPSTLSPLSLSSDDELSEEGFLTSDDECSDKELTALFQDV
ncbi:uncharacterized protein BX664DRAFT_329861 [Halteromyces radiatus]|uniref:uncharacterized protein n=1 Tax=Halteromyces radiatus TaxID=101107 RepID=UPI0022204E6D|nr:uncharacterized protein BX664DRAFT_329861 [Halteromyces radiatus]KAI8093502.1 hypothetical protein BX664DRAFT_329861 [Halteromyces radiatus]